MGTGGRPGQVAVRAVSVVLLLAACTTPADTSERKASDAATEQATAHGSATVDPMRADLDAALRDAAAALLAAPAYEGGLVGRVEDDVVTRAWGRQTDGGDTVEFVQFDIVSPSDGSAGSRAPAGDRSLQVAATVIVDDVRYQASRGPDGDRPWEISDEFGTRMSAATWGLTLQSMVEGQHTAGLDIAEVTVEEAPDGATTWRASGEQGEQHEWDVAPDGHLQAIRFGASATNDMPHARSWDIRFRVADTAPVVAAPEEGATLDLARFDIWDDLLPDP